MSGLAMTLFILAEIAIGVAVLVANEMSLREEMRQLSGKLSPPKAGGSDE